jgi:DUF4097 and DUF4098 domain-containing protein YvlB
MRAAISIIMFFMFVAVTVFAGTFEKEFNISPGKKLSINLQTGGSIEVTGWNKNSVKVLVEYRGSKFDEEGVDFYQSSSGLDIDVSYGSYNEHGLDFIINVPEKFDVDIQTMGGDISIVKVEGRFSGQTMGGALNLSEVKGKVEMTTMGGDIELTKSDLDGNLSTMGGRVLFEDVVGDVNGSSMGGNVAYRNVKLRNGEWRAREKEVSITTMGGEINVDDAPMGAAVKTMGGNIDIKRAKLYVKATTMGGNIDIGEIDGWIKANTMGGDISAVMVGDPDKGERDVEISSMGGDIELTLPAGISADFEIRLTYTKNSSQSYKIRSDFDLKIEESKEWEYSKGSPRKIIRGTGSVKGGKNRIKIETINGNILIRKGK